MVGLSLFFLRRLIFAFEQTTRNVPLVQPTLAAISSGLIPRSIKLGICSSTAAVIFFCLGTCGHFLSMTASPENQSSDKQRSETGHGKTALGR